MVDFFGQAEGEEYKENLVFAEKNQKVTYADFEKEIFKECGLYAIPRAERFQQMKQTIEKVLQALPALKRIFSKPITRLKDVDNVLPVESVRVINNQSVIHASLHSQLWGDVTKKGIKPRKLLTVDKQENYKTYENEVFAWVIKNILAYVNNAIYFLQDVMHANRDMKVNLLNRTDHINYFLALGKLRVGYVHMQERNDLLYEDCLRELLFLEKEISACLHFNVYKQCRGVNDHITLRKTNAFRLHKDYRQVYTLAKWFLDLKKIVEKKRKENSSEGAYAAYCNELFLFAVSHFNFEFPKTAKLNFMDLSVAGNYLNWKITIESLKISGNFGLKFSIKKERTYTIALAFNPWDENSEVKMQELRGFVAADEYLQISAFEVDKKNVIRLNVFDIDSFRRVQQLLLRAMIYADEQKERCPFCGGKMVLENEVAKCNGCLTEIRKRWCEKKGENFYSTEIGRKQLFKKSEKRADKYLFKRDAESQMHYRNITELSLLGEEICPKCGLVHEEEKKKIG